MTRICEDRGGCRLKKVTLTHCEQHRLAYNKSQLKRYHSRDKTRCLVATCKGGLVTKSHCKKHAIRHSLRVSESQCFSYAVRDETICIKPRCKKQVVTTTYCEQHRQQANKNYRRLYHEKADIKKWNGQTGV